MAGKITIRRIGSILPTVCLLLVFLLCVGVLALSTLGFPAAVLRYIERRAAEQGIVLHMDSLYLYPSRGLAVRAEGIELFADASAKHPLATVGSFSAGLNASHLLIGNIRPSFFMISRGQVQLPVTDPEGKQLEVNDLALAARFERGNRVQITSGFMRVQGIPIRVQGSCDLSMLSSESSSESPDLNRLIAEHQGVINKLYQHIEKQQWTPEQRPAIDIRLAIQEEFRISLRSSIPSFNLGQFRFRDAVVDLYFSKEAVTINSLSFHTVEPESFARLQGGYDLSQRRLSFRMESNAALLRMVRQMSEGSLKAYLEKFRHPDDSPPSVQMSGDICFEEDFTLQSARVRGDIVQKELRVGGTRIDAAEISFFYDNGNFNIDKLELAFPDGSLQCIASAQDGVGQAQLAADLPVQRVLTLMRELGVEDAALPEGLVLGERVQLQAHARLTTPAFKPGQTHWQGFVPTFHMLALELKTGSFAYSGYSLQQPSLRLQLVDIDQRRNLSLRALGAASLRLEAAHAEVPGEMHLDLTAPVVELSLGKLSCGEDSLPQALDSAVLSIQSRQMERSGEAPLTLQELSAEVQLQRLSCDLEAGLSSLRAEAVEARAELAQAEAAEARSGRMQLLLKSTPAELARSLQELILTSHIQASAEQLARGDTAIGSISLDFALPRSSPGQFALQLRPEQGEVECSLSATPSYVGENELTLSDIKGELPLSSLSILPALLGVELQDVELPERVSLSGFCTLGLEPLAFRQGAFRIEVPELVRTPWRQAVFAGKRVPLSLQAEAFLNNAPGSLFTYRVNLRAEHETGVFEGLIVGSSVGSLRITGTNTIRPDIVDLLIDNEDAHSIIRDFRFPAGGRAVIRDIDVRIDLSDGLRVDSACNVELHNTEYLISAIEDVPGGGERLRSDLGSNPYTLVNYATCQVLVHVVDGCHGPRGESLADESVVTINNPVLHYNNTPWLNRQGWAGGVRESRLDARCIIIDIEHSFVELQDVRGTVYPAYSLGMFYPDLQHYMEDVILPSPVQVETPCCVFPIYSDCTRPMSGTIRALSPGAAGFRFLGTTIPLEDFSGFINITDDYVHLDRMNAKSWEGVLDASVKIGISGKRTSFDGYAKAQCMNLQKIAAAYGSKQAPALCNGEIRFRSPSPELRDIKAYGHVDVEDGDLMTLSLFKPVSDLITDLPGHFLRLEKEIATTAGQPEPKPGFFTRLFGRLFKGLGMLTSKTGDSMGRMASNVPGMNHLIAYDLQEAHTNFDIINGFFVTRGMKVKGYNLNVSLNLAIDLNTLELSGNLWPRISSLPTILLAPFTFLSDFMVDIILYGKVDDIKWRIGLDRRAPTQPPTATDAPAADSPKPRRAAR